MTPAQGPFTVCSPFLQKRDPAFTVQLKCPLPDRISGSLLRSQVTTISSGLDSMCVWPLSSESLSQV